MLAITLEGELARFLASDRMDISPNSDAGMSVSELLDTVPPQLQHELLDECGTIIYHAARLCDVGGQYG